MADLVTTVPDGTQTQTPTTEAPVVKSLDGGAYGRMIAGQGAETPTTEAPAAVTSTPPAATTPPVTEGAPAIEENWFASDAPIVETPTDTPATQGALLPVYQQIAQELGVDLPTENVEEFVVNTVKGIREAVQSDPYRAEETVIAQNNYKLGLTDDQLLFVDKVTRLGKDLTHEQIEEIIETMPEDQRQREIETIRKSLETDNSTRLTNKANLEKQAIADRQAAEKQSAEQVAEQTRLFKESLSKHELDGVAITPRVRQEIERAVLSGDLGRYLNSPEGLIAAAMAMPQLNKMYLAARDKQIAEKAVSDSLKKIDGQQLQIGNGNFVTPGIRTLTGAEYGITQKQTT